MRPVRMRSFRAVASSLVATVIASPGWALAVMWSRACSAARRAARPLACSDEALPTRPSCPVIAASTSGSIGVVAA